MERYKKLDFSSGGSERCRLSLSLIYFYPRYLPEVGVEGEDREVVLYGERGGKNIG